MRSFAGKIIFVGLAILAFGCSSPGTGLGEKGLKPCPDSPNCVVSTGGDEGHWIAPISYRGDRAAARERMKSILSGMERTRVITDRHDYLHLEFRSRVMKFVDDVEFWFPDTEKIIHIRSAARLGYSDFGVNRERVETIRALFESGEKR